MLLEILYTPCSAPLQCSIL